jgi:hypothetical protein
VAVELSGAARRARIAVTVVYAINGAAYASAVPGYPQLRDAGGVSAAGWRRLALGGYPVGTVAAGMGAASAVCAGVAALAAVDAAFVLVGDLAGW